MRCAKTEWGYYVVLSLPAGIGLLATRLLIKAFTWKMKDYYHESFDMYHLAACSYYHVTC